MTRPAAGHVSSKLPFGFCRQRSPLSKPLLMSSARIGPSKSATSVSSKSCGNARRGSEVNPFAVIDPGDVQQQQQLVEILGHFVVAEDLLAKNRRARAGGQRERRRQGATAGGKS